MSENIEIRTIMSNRNMSTVSDTPVTDPASGNKVSTIFISQISQQSTHLLTSQDI